MTPDFLPPSLLWRAFGPVGGWFISRRPAERLKFEVQVNGPSHRSRIRILDSGKRPVILHATDWRIGRRRSRRCFDSVTWDHEILPQNTFQIGLSPYGLFPQIVSRYSGGEDLHTPFDVIVYEHAHHSFDLPMGGPYRYKGYTVGENAVVAADARKRMIAWFREHGTF